jgi:FKBP-type peptidyl-prolyl cis-trans isomerase
MKDFLNTRKLKNSPMYNDSVVARLRAARPVDQAELKAKMDYLNQQKEQFFETAKTDSLVAIQKKYYDSIITAPGKTVTGSGLVYEVIKTGVGDSPNLSSTCKLFYNGTTIDGIKFDGNMGTGQPPVEFPLTRLVEGWQEGIPLMNRGATYRFYIPPYLGYGAAGSPPVIGAYAVLIFDIELLDFK